MSLAIPEAEREHVDALVDHTREERSRIESSAEKDYGTLGLARGCHTVLGFPQS